jgi:hypothetical protein
MYVFNFNVRLLIVALFSKIAIVTVAEEQFHHARYNKLFLKFTVQNRKEGEQKNE